MVPLNWFFSSKVISVGEEEICIQQCALSWNWKPRIYSAPIKCSFKKHLFLLKLAFVLQFLSCING